MFRIISKIVCTLWPAFLFLWITAAVYLHNHTKPFKDVASDDQSPILIRNAEKFFKHSGTAMIAIKARSINVVKEPKAVYKEQLALLEKHFKVIEKLELDPYEKDHIFAVLKPR